MTKTRIALVFGGRSSEHEISCATAGGVLQAIDRERFDVIPVGITRTGNFVLQPDDPERYALELRPEVVDTGQQLALPTTTDATDTLVRDVANDAVTSLGHVEIVFPILHGPLGEDGTIQGMLELAGIPYVGNGVLSSAVGMDKHFTKTVLQQAGIAVAPWITVARREWKTDRAAVLERAAALPLPVFVKPARAGSSVGVSKVRTPDELPAALDLAFAEDSRALIEVGVQGREIELAVLAGRDGAAPRVSVAGEVVMTGRDFYDYDAKYLDAPGVELVVPADVDADTLASLQSIAARAFEAIGGAGLARVDFFVTDEGPIVNEINTMPGFTRISMFPQLWGASGLSYRDLITELIELGLEEER